LKDLLEDLGGAFGVGLLTQPNKAINFGRISDFG
jgi:hypothetical protein